MRTAIILTGASLRHTFVRHVIASDPDIRILSSYCESTEGSLESIIANESNDDNNCLRKMHLIAREQSEKDFFKFFIDKTYDKSNPIFIKKNEINQQHIIEAIKKHNPDVIAAYGCSIIKGELLEHFNGRFLNVHLGLSPYYRGSGTNYWPLVNCAPEYVGATFMFINSGIDTGDVIHQIRAKIEWGDTPSIIGNRLIQDMSLIYTQIIKNLPALPRMLQLTLPKNVFYYKNSDYTEESVQRLYNNFRNGLVNKYINNRAACCTNIPIITNPGL